jgi:hypothetical protein
MFFFKKRVPRVNSPRVGLLDLGSDETKALVAADRAFLSPLFGEVKNLHLGAPQCDVLFIYAEIAADGSVPGSSCSFRELIRDSGAKVVVIASENSVDHYIKAFHKESYGNANLVMTLNRHGEAFGRFFGALFEKMLEGTPMQVAWVRLNPQVPGLSQADAPETIFTCEIGQLTFK